MHSVLPGQLQHSGPEQVPQDLADQGEGEAPAVYKPAAHHSEDASVLYAFEGISAQVKHFKADLTALFDAQSRELKKDCDELCRQYFEEPSARIANNAHGSKVQFEDKHTTVVTEVNPYLHMPSPARITNNAHGIEVQSEDKHDTVVTKVNSYLHMPSLAGITNNAHGSEVQFEDKHDTVVTEVNPCPSISGRRQRRGGQLGLSKQSTRHIRGNFSSVADKDHDNMQMNMLLKAFLMSEEHQQEIEQQKRFTWRYRIRHLRTHSFTFLFDSVILGIVGLNAIFLGVTLDIPPANWLIVADAMFTSLFLFEVLLKLSCFGYKQHYCSGSGVAGNWWDLLLVVFDMFSLVFQFLQVDVGLNASLLRLFRLGKLARLGRVFRLPAAQTLVGMIEGLLGGLTTLFWSIVLYVLILFVVSLLFRELLGHEVRAIVYENFNSVPRSLLTTFRCSFGDCSAASGVPIFEYVHKEYGTFYSILCCSFTFMITVGLFNVVSAIFVESTLAASARFANSKKQDRLTDERLWCDKLTILVKRLCYVKNGSAPEEMSSAMAMLAEMTCDKSVIDAWARDTEVRRALEDLDIDPKDFNELSDILDPDQSETIEVPELQEGLRRLRGFTRRSDVLRIDLMVREVLRGLSDLEATILEQTGAGKDSPLRTFKSSGTLKSVDREER